MAAAALASVVVSDMACSIDSHSTQGTSTGRLSGMAQAMADLFTIALTATAKELGTGGTNKSTFCQMALVVVTIFIFVAAGFLTNIDHTVITTVITVTVTVAAACLRDRVTGTQFSTRTVIIFTDPSAMLIIIGVLFGVGSADHIVLGFAGAGVNIAG
jgi:hypothetical protein